MSTDYFSLASDRGINLYQYMYEEVKRYQNAHLEPHLRVADPNFEDILFVLASLGAMSPAGIFTSALGAFISRREFPDIVHMRTLKPVNSDVFRHLIQHLSDSILEHFRILCRKRAHPIKELQQFFDALNSKFEIAVVTTNYDNLVYRALPKGIETGFNNNGVFNDERIFQRLNWPCILHLHGSVHFNMRPDIISGELHQIFWEANLEQCQQNSFGRSAKRTVEGHEFPTSSIIAGYGKTEQIQCRPFRTYYSEVDRLVNQSDAVLFLGCGFGDSHLVAAFEGYRDSRNRPVVIIDYATDDAMTAGSRLPSESSRVTLRAMEVFKTPPHSMRWLNYQFPDTVAKLRAAMEFERSADASRPLAIWYNGMRTACLNSTKIIAELERLPAPEVAP